MDRLTALQVFARVIELGSFQAAADALGLSRPMVSKHVQALEAQLGVRLLNRTTRALSPTEAGQAVHLRAQRIIEEFDAARSEAGLLQIEPRGQLRVNAPVTFGRAHLARAVAEFQARWPAVSVELTLGDRVVDIVDEGYDLAIRIGRLPDSSLIARVLAPCRMLLCAAPAYLAAHGTPRRPADLAGHNCLIYMYMNQERRWAFQGPQGPVSIGVDGNFRTNFGEAAAEAAAAGLGIVLEPSFTLAPYLADGRLVQLMPDHPPQDLAVHAVYPAGRTLPLKVRAFIDHLASRFGNPPYWDAGLTPPA